MRRGHGGDDAGREDHSRARRQAPARRAALALLGGAFLLPLGACAGEEPSTEPPDPGAPITRSPS